MKLRRKVSSLPPLSIPYPDSYIFPLDTDTCIRHDFAFCVLLRFLDPPTFISFLPNLNFVSFFIVLSDFAGFDRQRWSGRRLRSTKIESSWWNESRNSRDYQGIGIYRRNGSRARLPTRIRATFRRHGRLIECVKRGLVVNSYTEKERERERQKIDEAWPSLIARCSGTWRFMRRVGTNLENGAHEMVYDAAFSIIPRFCRDLNRNLELFFGFRSILISSSKNILPMELLFFLNRIRK